VIRKIRTERGVPEGGDRKRRTITNDYVRKRSARVKRIEDTSIR
jgi:hypothetical protein